MCIYRRSGRRKANLEVTGEEKPKTRLRRRKANKRLCREKKPVCALLDEEKPVSLVSDEKKPVCAVLRWKITTNDISREKKNRNLLAKILLILLISRTRNLESIYSQFPVHHRLWTSVYSTATLWGAVHITPFHVYRAAQAVDTGSPFHLFVCFILVLSLYECILTMCNPRQSE